MTERISALLGELRERGYRKNRRALERDITSQTAGKGRFMRDALRFTAMLDSERPVLFAGERIGFNRDHADIPFYIDRNGNRSGGSFGNITPDYGRLIASGIDSALEQLAAKREALPPERREFIDSLVLELNSCISLADRYREAAQSDCPELAAALGRVPRKWATTLHEACVFMKLLIFALRCNSNVHVTLGRFDQYMLPYYTNDIERGRSGEELLELLEEFFISLNFDTDLYSGVQQGDNGQSMVLGGYDGDGNDMYNPLSELCMKASLELDLIDPKINLRVSSKTPFERFLFGTEMTKRGLGFPQYCNDDVVVPGLVRLGYDPEDALDYTVAACWEFIIPNKGADYPNIITMNFPKVTAKAISEHINECDTFEELMLRVKEGFAEECGSLRDEANRSSEILYCPSPFLSLLVDGCFESCRDISENGAKYNNFGCHGAGISNAADALAAVRKTVYEDKTVSKSELLAALASDFAGAEELRHRLLDCPKTGNNDDYVDSIACEIMGYFADGMNGKPNCRGGVFRAGTGSAMEYIWSASKVGATADGRHACAPYGSSFSPSLTARLSGPLSVIQSFTKFDMRNIINGGPLTMEIHDTVFRNSEGTEKVARLVQSYIALGGHQLQLNSVNRDRLLDAQKHPENYPNLIVRVWGWSGYFNELELDYQEHIIKRTEFGV